MFGLSEREHAERSLRETEQHYHAIIKAAADVILTISPQARLTSLNPAFERMTGWSRKKWLHKPLHKLVHPEDLSIALDMLGRALRAELPPHIRAAPTGELRPIPERRVHHDRSDGRRGSDKRRGHRARRYPP